MDLSHHLSANLETPSCYATYKSMYLIQEFSLDMTWFDINTLNDCCHNNVLAVYICICERFQGLKIQLNSSIGSVLQGAADLWLAYFKLLSPSINLIFSNPCPSFWRTAHERRTAVQEWTRRTLPSHAATLDDWTKSRYKRKLYLNKA